MMESRHMLHASNPNLLSTWGSHRTHTHTHTGCVQLSCRTTLSSTKLASSKSDGSVCLSVCVDTGCGWVGVSPHRFCRDALPLCACHGPLPLEQHTAVV
jgi:hypothetical protein